MPRRCPTHVVSPSPLRPGGSPSARHTHTNEASEQARYKSTALVGERLSSGHECQVEEVVDMEHVWLGAFLKYSSHTAKAQTDGTGILSRRGGPLRTTHTHTHTPEPPPTGPPPPPRGGFPVGGGSPQVDSRATQVAPAHVAPLAQGEGGGGMDTTPNQPLARAYYVEFMAGHFLAVGRSRIWDCR